MSIQSRSLRQSATSKREMVVVAIKDFKRETNSKALLLYVDDHKAEGSMHSLYLLIYKELVNQYHTNNALVRLLVYPHSLVPHIHTCCLVLFVQSMHTSTGERLRLTLPTKVIMTSLVVAEEDGARGILLTDTRLQYSTG
jgi:hypothetical protein